jgi:hypothetical protein
MKMKNFRIKFKINGREIIRKEISLLPSSEINFSANTSQIQLNSLRQPASLPLSPIPRTLGHHGSTTTTTGRDATAKEMGLAARRHIEIGCAHRPSPARPRVKRPLLQYSTTITTG